MHAAVVPRYGTPDVLTPCEVPRPRPGAGQLLIRNEAVGVNFRDTWIRSGAVAPPPGGALPLILGNEVGGTVTDVGEDVPSSFEGAQVVASTGGSGGYADYALARVGDLVRVPSGVDIADATAVFVQGRVALGAFRAAHTGPFERVLILGVAGGVGTLLAQLTARLGATTIIGANRTRAKAALAEPFGVTHPVGYRDESFSERVHQLAPDGIDVVFDGVGGPAAQTAFGHLARGTGRHVAYGYASGTPLTVDTSDLIPRGISVLGFGGQALLPGVNTALVGEVLELLGSGDLRPVIGQRFPLVEANEAHRAIEARNSRGKTLLIPQKRG